MVGVSISIDLRLQLQREIFLSPDLDSADFYDRVVRILERHPEADPPASAGALGKKLVNLSCRLEDEVRRQVYRSLAGTG